MWTLSKPFLPYIAGLLIVIAAIFYHNYAVDASYDDGYTTGVEWQKQEQANADSVLAKKLSDEKVRIENEAQSKIDAARVAAANAATNAGRLQQQIADIRAELRNGAASLGISTPTGKTFDMLTFVLGESIESNRALAEYADRAANAGSVCEHSYDSLRVKYEKQNKAPASN